MKTLSTPTHHYIKATPKHIQKLLLAMTEQNFVVLDDSETDNYIQAWTATIS